MRERERKGSEILVVGAGGVGLAVALALAEEGADVAVFERGRPAEAATRAAGGMLSPLAEAAGPGAFLDLCLDSFALWPTFAARIEERTGARLELRREGKLLLALDASGRIGLERRQAWLSGAGFPTTWLEDAELVRREPAIAERGACGLHLDVDGQVDNRALGRALRTAAVRAGCRIHSDTPVSSLLHKAGRVRGVRTGDGREHSARTVVLAAGAWSGGLEGLPGPLPVRPVKGEMLALSVGRPLLRTAVETHGCYLIPRGSDAHASVWVGATSEEVGFQAGNTLEGRAALRAAAAAAVPELAEATETEAWFGFRPGTTDDLPVLGPDPVLEGLIHATGHFRNGILLIPVTAELVASVIAGRPEPRLAPFLVDRFERV